MTTLAVDTPRDKILGEHNDIPVIALDIIFEGAAVGVVKATGHARPLTAADRFVGFAREKCDNSAGAAAAKNVRVDKRGVVELAVTGAVITDIGQPVYATDDNAFTFIPTGAVFIGFVKRFVSSGVVEVEFDADLFSDPYKAYGAPGGYETVTDDVVLDIQDNGKVFFVNIDAKSVFLPLIPVPLVCTIVNIGAFGAFAVTVVPHIQTAAEGEDMIHAPDIAGTNEKAHINTKATAQRGDLVQIGLGDANGWAVTNQIGIWAQET